MKQNQKKNKNHHKCNVGQNGLSSQLKRHAKTGRTKIKKKNIKKIKSKKLWAGKERELNNSTQLMTQ